MINLPNPLLHKILLTAARGDPQTCQALSATCKKTRAFCQNLFFFHLFMPEQSLPQEASYFSDMDSPYICCQDEEGRFYIGSSPQIKGEWPTLYILDSGTCHTVNLQKKLQSRITPRSPWGFPTEDEPLNIYHHKGKFLVLCKGWISVWQWEKEVFTLIKCIDLFISYIKPELGDKQVERPLIQSQFFQEGKLFLKGTGTDFTLCLDADTFELTSLDSFPERIQSLAHMCFSSQNSQYALSLLPKDKTLLKCSPYKLTPVGKDYFIFQKSENNPFKLFHIPTKRVIALSHKLLVKFRKKYTLGAVTEKGSYTRFVFFASRRIKVIDIPQGSLAAPPELPLDLWKVILTQAAFSNPHKVLPLARTSEKFHSILRQNVLNKIVHERGTFLPLRSLQESTQKWNFLTCDSKNRHLYEAGLDFYIFDPHTQKIDLLKSGERAKVPALYKGLKTQVYEYKEKLIFFQQGEIFVWEENKESKWSCTHYRALFNEAADEVVKSTEFSQGKLFLWMTTSASLISYCIDFNSCDLDTTTSIYPFKKSESGSVFQLGNRSYLLKHSLMDYRPGLRDFNQTEIFELIKDEKGKTIGLGRCISRDNLLLKRVIHNHNYVLFQDQSLYKTLWILDKSLKWTQIDPLVLFKKSTSYFLVGDFLFAPSETTCSLFHIPSKKDLSPYLTPFPKQTLIGASIDEKKALLYLSFRDTKGLLSSTTFHFDNQLKLEAPQIRSSPLQEVEIEESEEEEIPISPPLKVETSTLYYPSDESSSDEYGSEAEDEGELVPEPPPPSEPPSSPLLVTQEPVRKSLAERIVLVVGLAILALSVVATTLLILKHPGQVVFQNSRITLTLPALLTLNLGGASSIVLIAVGSYLWFKTSSATQRARDSLS